MASSARGDEVGHPSAGRHQVSTLLLSIGLFGSLVCWVLQMELSEIISSHACYPHDVTLNAPLWGWTHGALAAISIAGVAGSALATFIAWRSFRQVRRDAGGGQHHTIEVGEGRLRFLTMIGTLASLLFLVATVFTACAILIVSPCQPWSGL